MTEVHLFLSIEDWEDDVGSGVQALGAVFALIIPV